MKWLTRLFIRRAKPLSPPHPACIVGHKKYYQIRPWKRAK